MFKITAVAVQNGRAESNGKSFERSRPPNLVLVPILSRRYNLPWLLNKILQQSGERQKAVTQEAAAAISSRAGFFLLSWTKPGGFD